MKPSLQQYRKAVVLGAAGFIGINLVQALSRQGYDVVCFDRIASPHWPESVRCIEGDFVNPPDELMKVLDQAIIFHLVSSCRPSSGTTQAVDELSQDLIATIRYLEGTKDKNVRWVFLSSGGTVYGQTNAEKLSETDPTNPICTYGAAKLAIEKYFFIYHTLHNLDCVIVRLSNPYGPWQYPGRGQGVIATLLYKAFKGEKIEIWGDGEQVRDYIYIDDAVEGIISVALLGKHGDVYNVGTGEGYSLNQLIIFVEQTFGMTLLVEYMQPRNLDVRRNVLNLEKVTGQANWNPKTLITLGMKAAALWMQRANLEAAGMVAINVYKQDDSQESAK